MINDGSGEIIIDDQLFVPDERPVYNTVYRVDAVGSFSWVSEDSSVSP